MRLVEQVTFIESIPRSDFRLYFPSSNFVRITIFDGFRLNKWLLRIIPPQIRQIKDTHEILGHPRIKNIETSVKLRRTRYLEVLSVLENDQPNGFLRTTHGIGCCLVNRGRTPPSGTRIPLVLGSREKGFRKRYEFRTVATATVDRWPDSTPLFCRLSQRPAAAIVFGASSLGSIVVERYPIDRG